jgi:murein DD-endopeptidase MepM/ murein hydrolase activator NlpD
MVGKWQQCVYPAVILVMLCTTELWAQAPTFTRVGMAKPLAGVRDYNGTYSGSIGTGSIGFGRGTLYRDNYDNGATSGCWGEGCGKHPGVDIPVVAGSNVFASLEGRVVISRCDSGWGGLVVVQGQDPFDYGTSVNFVYGHLRQRLVKVDERVTTGQLIGYSGGRQGVDECAGNSTGAHLHFQVDKDDGNFEPWFPHSGSINRADSDFEVARMTLSPLVFVQGGYYWDFAQSGNREYWDIFNWQSWGVSNSALWFDGGVDPFIRRGGFTNCGSSTPCSNALTVDASMYRWVFLDVFSHCYSPPGKIYFTTNIEPYWDEAKSVSYNPLSWGAWSGSTHMYSNPKWKGTITGLRIDPSVQCSLSGFDPIYIGEIRLER